MGTDELIHCVILLDRDTGVELCVASIYTEYCESSTLDRTENVHD